MRLCDYHNRDRELQGIKLQKNHINGNCNVCQNLADRADVELDGSIPDIDDDDIEAMRRAQQSKIADARREGYLPR